jgi:hypothetical protein
VRPMSDCVSDGSNASLTKISLGTRPGRGLPERPRSRGRRRLYRHRQQRLVWLRGDQFEKIAGGTRGGGNRSSSMKAVMVTVWLIRRIRLRLANAGRQYAGSPRGAIGEARDVAERSQIPLGQRYRQEQARPIATPSRIIVCELGRLEGGFRGGCTSHFTQLTCLSSEECLFRLPGIDKPIP